MAFAADYSWARPGGAALAAAGVKAVGRYVNDPGGKGINTSELHDLQSHGVAVWLIFETSGQDATGSGNGVADARAAQSAVNALGFPHAVVYFAIDEQNAPDLTDYFQGIARVIPLARIGVYGGLDTIQAAQRARLASFFWQTYAWSRGEVASGIHLYQYLNGQTINGGAVDYCRTLEANFGQIVGSAAPSSPAAPGGGADLGQNESGHPTSWVQKRLNVYGFGLAVDNVLGPNTTAAIRAFQAGHGLTVDGIVGPATTAVLSKTPPAAGKLVVDGILGPLTIRAEQRSLKVAVDGIRGPVTVRAEQHRTGAKVDGIDGPDTRSHLQKHVGAKVDGIWGPDTTRHLQEALNAGKF